MKKLHIILVLLLLALVSPTFGQKTKGKSKKQLQSEITSLQNEISTANQLLKKTKKDRAFRRITTRGTGYNPPVPSGTGGFFRSACKAEGERGEVAGHASARP